MFYSQTFLARKGPLGTVWCAAHLQHRLKKSHYTATDIPSTVERIMFPEVPIALRMSGHLLLGVVRIYSKKVDYLFHDCNIILVGLRKVFTCAQVNLPEDARQAPVQAITLPPTLDLDAMELDGDIFNEGASDNNLSSQEDITLRADQIPIERDLYVAITFDDDIMMDASLPQEFSNINDNLNESPDNGRVSFQDSGQQNQIEVPTTIAAFQDPGPSNQTAAHGATEDYENAGPSSQRRVLESTSNESSEDIQEIEKMRDAPHDSYTKDFSLVHSDNRDDPAEGTALIEQVLSVKETHTPSLNKLASGVSSMPSQQHSDPPTSDASKGPHEVSFEFPSPQLVIQPSPTVQLPRKRRVPRQRFFDEKLVLPNRLMKRALEDCSDLVKKRRKIPCSALGVWKLNNSRKMEQVFTESSLTGLCTDICNMFGREYISTKPHLVPDVVPEPTVPHSTAPTTEPISNIRTEQYPASTPDHGARSSPISAPEIDREIEHLRYNESSATENIFAEFGSFHSGFMPTPSRRDGSPLSTDRLESGLSPKGVTSSADILSLGGTRASEIDTPRTLLDEQSPQGNTGFSAIPEFGSSDADLYFLEEDSNTPTESGANKGVDSLSVRTRAVAKYLKSHSPISPLSEDSSGDLSLNKILEGKTRKICARMFFETLVLKNYELVDVRQEEAYGDITLTLTSKLSMARI